MLFFGTFIHDTHLLKGYNTENEEYIELVYKYATQKLNIGSGSQHVRIHSLIIVSFTNYKLFLA